MNDSTTHTNRFRLSENLAREGVIHATAIRPQVQKAARIVAKVAINAYLDIQINEVNNPETIDAFNKFVSQAVYTTTRIVILPTPAQAAAAPGSYNAKEWGYAHLGLFNGFPIIRVFVEEPMTDGGFGEHTLLKRLIHECIHVGQYLVWGFTDISSFAEDEAKELEESVLAKVLRTTSEDHIISLCQGYRASCEATEALLLSQEP